MRENGPAGTEVGAEGAPGTRQRLPVARERPTGGAGRPPAAQGYPRRSGPGRSCSPWGVARGGTDGRGSCTRGDP